MTKAVWSKWLDIGLILVLHFFIDLDFILVFKNQTELVLYSAILTSYFVNDAFVAKVITCFIVMFSVLQLSQPTVCRNPVCQNRTRFMLDINKSRYVDFQKVRIQETQAELPRGSIPRRFVSFSKIFLILFY